MFRLAALAGVAILSAASSCLSQSPFTCADWRAWSPEARSAYLAGWVDGRATGTFEAAAKFAPSVAARWNTDTSVAAMFSDVSVGQTQRGMDTFCADYRNERIGMRFAAGMVFREAAGFHHYTEAELAEIRRHYGTPGVRP
jgi:hypothetical protein